MARGLFGFPEVGVHHEPDWQDDGNGVAVGDEDADE